MQESQKINSEGFFEIKLRKPRPGLLKHYWMGKTQRDLDYFRFDALISDRQVLGGFLSLEIFPISFKLPNWPPYNRLMVTTAWQWARVQNRPIGRRWRHRHRQHRQKKVPVQKSGPFWRRIRAIARNDTVSDVFTYTSLFSKLRAALMHKVTSNVGCLKLVDALAKLKKLNFFKFKNLSYF